MLKKMFLLALVVAPLAITASDSSAFGANSCTYSPPSRPLTPPRPPTPEPKK